MNEIIIEQPEDLEINDNGFNIELVDFDNVEPLGLDEAIDARAAEQPAEKFKDIFQNVEQVADQHTHSETDTAVYRSSENGHQLYLSKNRDNKDMFSGKDENRMSMNEMFQNQNEENPDQPGELVSRYQNILDELYSQGYSVTEEYHDNHYEGMIKDVYYADERGRVEVITYLVEQKTEEDWETEDGPLALFLGDDENGLSNGGENETEELIPALSWFDRMRAMASAEVEQQDDLEKSLGIDSNIEDEQKLVVESTILEQQAAFGQAEAKEVISKDEPKSEEASVVQEESVAQAEVLVQALPVFETFTEPAQAAVNETVVESVEYQPEAVPAQAESGISMFFVGPDTAPEGAAEELSIDSVTKSGITEPATTEQQIKSDAEPKTQIVVESATIELDAEREQSTFEQAEQITSFEDEPKQAVIELAPDETPVATVALGLKNIDAQPTEIIRTAVAEVVQAPAIENKFAALRNESITGLKAKTHDENGASEVSNTSTIDQEVSAEGKEIANVQDEVPVTEDLAEIVETPVTAWAKIPTGIDVVVSEAEEGQAAEKATAKADGDVEFVVDATRAAVAKSVPTAQPEFTTVDVLSATPAREAITIQQDVTEIPVVAHTKLATREALIASTVSTQRTVTAPRGVSTSRVLSTPRAVSTVRAIPVPRSVPIPRATSISREPTTQHEASVSRNETTVSQAPVIQENIRQATHASVREISNNPITIADLKSAARQSVIGKSQRSATTETTARPTAAFNRPRVSYPEQTGLKELLSKSPTAIGANAQIVSSINETIIHKTGIELALAA